MSEDTSGDIDVKSAIGVLEEKLNQIAEQIKTTPSNGTDVSIADRKKGANSKANKINRSEENNRDGQVSLKLENGEKEIKIGAFVRSTLSSLVKKEAIVEDMVAMLCNKNYCKQTFDLNYPFLFTSYVP